MSAKHTPGPWNAFNSIKAIGVGSERSDVAWVRFEECGLMDTARSQEEDEANARLIAAAPELLAALQEVAEWDKVGAFPCVHAAIAKATK